MGGGAGRVLLGQLLGHVPHLGPGGGSFFGVEAGSFEGVLVPVQNGGGALERNGVSLALELGVFHEGRIKRVHPSCVIRGLDEVVHRHHSIFIGQQKQVGGQQNSRLRGVAAFDRRQDFGHGLLIVAGIDRLDLDARVFFLETGGVVVDDLGDWPADGDWKIHAHFDICSRRGGGCKPGGHGQCGKSPA